MKIYLIILIATALFSSGCAIEAVETVPEESVVVQTDPPFVGAVWIGAEYDWSNGRYVAIPGHWEKPRGRWERGHWNHTRRGYHWERGSWR